MMYKLQEWMNELRRKIFANSRYYETSFMATTFVPYAEMDVNTDFVYRIGKAVIQQITLFKEA